MVLSTLFGDGSQHALPVTIMVACVAGVIGEGEGEGERGRREKMRGLGRGERERLPQEPRSLHFCVRQRTQISDWLIFDSKSLENWSNLIPLTVCPVWYKTKWRARRMYYRRLWPFFELGFEQRISIETRARSCSKSTSRRKGCVGGFTDRKLTTLCGDIHTPKRFRRRIQIVLWFYFLLCH